MALPTSDFRLQASRAVRKYISVVSSHSVVVLYGRLRKLIYLFSPKVPRGSKECPSWAGLGGMSTLRNSIVDTLSKLGLVMELSSLFSIGTKYSGRADARWWYFSIRCKVDSNA